MGQVLRDDNEEEYSPAKVEESKDMLKSLRSRPWPMSKKIKYLKHHRAILLKFEGKLSRRGQQWEAIKRKVMAAKIWFSIFISFTGTSQLVDFLKSKYSAVLKTCLIPWFHGIAESKGLKVTLGPPFHRFSLCSVWFQLFLLSVLWWYNIIDIVWNRTKVVMLSEYLHFNLDYCFCDCTGNAHRRKS